MAESICAHDAPPSSPTLATMAVTAGAAVLAGAMLGRKGLTGIAAGVAAFAGARWYSGARSIALEPLREDTTAVVDLSPEVHPPKDEPADWVDHDAVDFGHIVPNWAEAAEMLTERVLPLLDDYGNPVDFFARTLALSHVGEPEFPPPPTVCEAGRFPQSASAATSKTVWFGMQDVTPEPQVHPLPTPAVEVPPPGLPPLATAAPSVVEATAPATAVPSPIATSVGLAAITHPARVQAAHAQNPFLAPLARQAETAPLPVQAPMATGAPSACNATPFASAAFGGLPVSFMPAGNATGASIVTARPPSFLPQPRRPGELPKHIARKVPGSGPAFSEASFAPGHLSLEPQTSPQRHLERLAPVSMESEEKGWPIWVLLCLITVIIVAVTANRWHDDALQRPVEALPLLQNAAGVGHAGASPADATPAAAGDPAKHGPWIEPAPAPAPEPAK